MSYNESETRFYLIDPVLRSKGYDAHWKLKMETPAPVEPTGNRGRRRSGGGRTDYLLCVQAPGMQKPLPVGAGCCRRQAPREWAARERPSLAGRAVRPARLRPAKAARGTCRRPAGR